MSYDPAPLHLLNDIGRAVVAYAQPPLHHRDRRVTSLDHNFYGIIEFRVDFAIGLWLRPAQTKYFSRTLLRVVPLHSLQRARSHFIVHKRPVSAPELYSMGGEP